MSEKAEKKKAKRDAKREERREKKRASEEKKQKRLAEEKASKQRRKDEKEADLNQRKDRAREALAKLEEQAEQCPAVFDERGTLTGFKKRGASRVEKIGKGPHCAHRKESKLTRKERTQQRVAPTPVCQPRGRMHGVAQCVRVGATATRGWRRGRVRARRLGPRG